MILNNSIYIDLEIPDLELKNFLKPEDFIDFEMTEVAGASLPTICFMFKTLDERVKNAIQENNKILVSVGSSSADADTFPVIISLVKTQDQTGDSAGWVIQFGGFIYSKSFMVNQDSVAYTGDSVGVAKQIIEEEIGADKFKSDVAAALENKVTWRRNNETARKFLADTLLHMNIIPSFPMFAFDKYGNFLLKSFNQLAKTPPKCNLVPWKPTSANEFQYVNTFKLENFKNMQNMYSGYNKRVELTDTSTGKVTTVVLDNEPILASTKVAEKSESGGTVTMNKLQNDNVHKTYYEAYAWNTNKLVTMSAYTGQLILAGRYMKELAPLDLILVSVEDNVDTTSGLYIIESIRTVTTTASGTVFTILTVSRDNKNCVENYIAKKSQRFKVDRKIVQDLCAATHGIRQAISLTQYVLDGRFRADLLNFIIATKRNLLRAININGYAIDFNSYKNLVASMKYAVNSIMNGLIRRIFPYQIAYVFRDFLLLKPAMRDLLATYTNTFVPSTLRGPIDIIINHLWGINNAIDAIIADNKITIDKKGDTGMGENLVTPPTEEDKKVDEVIKELEENTKEVDIPFPIITLNEAQALLPKEKLRKYIVNEVIENLTNLGYLTDIDVNDFEDYLLGKAPDDVVQNIVIKLNKEYPFQFRYWGTYSNYSDMASYLVKKTFKDKYKFLPCSKLVSAIGNKGIYFACPSSEEGLKFYINSKRVKDTEMESFQTHLGFVDDLGRPIPYTVYYTTTRYNSNSVLLEVKQGGMV